MPSLAAGALPGWGSGGRRVDGYAGGVAVQTGDPADVNRLLIAAAHHQASLDRRAGKLLEGATLLEMVADRFPDNLELQLARVESIVNDRKDPTAAVTSPRATSAVERSRPAETRRRVSSAGTRMPSRRASAHVRSSRR